MKKVQLLSGLILITALAASGCEYADFQTIAASPQATESSDSKDIVPVPSASEGEDVIVPSGEGVGTTGGTTGGTGVEEEAEAPVEEEAVCVPETDSEFCARLAKDCDAVAANDNCGTPRTADCGSCTAGFVCGGVTPNVCAPATGTDCYRYDFVSTRNGYDNIYSGSTCSKEAPVQLTKNTSEESSFRNLQISSDGKKIAYDFIYAGIPDWTLLFEDTATTGLGGTNLAGSRSPAFNATQDRMAYVTPTGLNIINLLDTFDSDLVVSDEQDSRTFERIVWSPVKTETEAAYNKIVFSSKDKSGPDTLHVYDVTASEERPVYEQYNGRFNNVILKGNSPDISQDGKRLTFVRKDFSNQDQIWICDLVFNYEVPSSGSSLGSSTGSSKEHLCVNPRLLTETGNNTAPHWTSNGKHIFFTSDRDGNKEIYIMKADGTDETNLTQDPAADRDSDSFPLLRAVDPAGIRNSDSIRAAISGS